MQNFTKLLVKEKIELARCLIGRSPLRNRALLVVIIKEQNYTKLPKLFLFPENPLPPHKGDRGILERRKALAALVLFVGRTG